LNIVSTSNIQQTKISLESALNHVTDTSCR